MAWLAVDLALPIDPRTLHLSELMGWSPDETVGRLLRLWGWCLNFAPDGDLTKFPVERIAQGIGLPGSDGERLRAALLRSGWVEEKPYFRVHDWWGSAGMFLKGRYSRTPHVWRRIQALYTPRKRGSSGGRTHRKPGSGQLRDSSGAAPEQLKSSSRTTPEQSTNSSGTAPEQLKSSSPPVLLQTTPLPVSAPVQTKSISDCDQVSTTSLPASVLVQTKSISDCDQVRIREQKKRDTEIKKDLSPPPPPPLPALAEGDEGREEDLSGHLRQEVLQRTALSRLSPADEREISRLVRAHGRRAIEACQHLHSGIKNATGYLKVILEGKEGPDAELESFKRYVRARGLG